MSLYNMKSKMWHTSVDRPSSKEATLFDADVILHIAHSGNLLPESKAYEIVGVEEYVALLILSERALRKCG